jgi:hypothetical protein
MAATAADLLDSVARLVPPRAVTGASPLPAYGAVVPARAINKVLALGAQMIVEWGATSGTNTFSPSPPLYQLNVNDLDRLVAKIFEASSRNPLFFTSYLAGFPHAREIIMRDNPAAAQLLPPASYQNQTIQGFREIRQFDA